MRIVIVIALFVTLVLTACGGTAPTAMASPTPLTVLAPTPEATPTTATTPTPLPAVTTTAIPVATATDTPTPVPTATAAPATPIAPMPAPASALTPTPQTSSRITPTTVVTTINPGTPTPRPGTATSAATRIASPATSTAGVPTRTVPVTSTPAHGNQLEMLAAGERQWQQSGIASYRIVVTDANFVRIQTNTITVRNGAVVDQSATCTGPAIRRSLPCKVQPFNAMDYIVPGLFARAQGDLANTTRTTTFTLDPQYGYPRAITTRIPNLYDSEHDVRVMTFTVL